MIFLFSIYLLYVCGYLCKLRNIIKIYMKFQFLLWYKDHELFYYLVFYKMGKLLILINCLWKTWSLHFHLSLGREESYHHSITKVVIIIVFWSIFSLFAWLHKIVVTLTSSPLMSIILFLCIIATINLWLLEIILNGFFFIYWWEHNLPY